MGARRAETCGAQSRGQPGVASAHAAASLRLVLICLLRLRNPLLVAACAGVLAHACGYRAPVECLTLVGSGRLPERRHNYEADRDGGNDSEHDIPRDRRRPVAPQFAVPEYQLSGCLPAWLAGWLVDRLAGWLAAQALPAYPCTSPCTNHTPVQHTAPVPNPRVYDFVRTCSLYTLHAPMYCPTNPYKPYACTPLVPACTAPAANPHVSCMSHKAEQIESRQTVQRWAGSAPHHRVPRGLAMTLAWLGRRCFG